MWFTSVQTPTTSNLSKEISTMSIYAHYTIYKITNLINNKVYIGQTIQKPKNRWKQHKCSGNRKNTSKTAPLYYSMRKHGLEKFIFEPICSCFDIGELNLRETYFILLYHSNEAKFGYNCDTGGDRKILSIETKERMSLSRKGKTYEEFYGVEKAKDMRKQRSDQGHNLCKLNEINAARKLNPELHMHGPDHPNYDQTIYHLVHKDGRVEFATKHEMGIKYKTNIGYITGKYAGKTSKGWTIVPPDFNGDIMSLFESDRKCPRFTELNKTRTREKHPRYDHTIYHWLHKDGTEEFCTRYDLCKKYKQQKIKVNSLGYVIKGVHSHHKGWAYVP